MTTCDPSPTRVYENAVEVSDLADLAAILDPKVNIAIWRRPVDPKITALLNLPETRFDNPWRTVVHSTDETLAHRIADLVPPVPAATDPTGAAALAADVRTVCEAFAELVAADELMISLEEAKRATCPRFHVDRVGIRLLVTYCGPGTEWLPHEQVDRRFLGPAGMDLPDDQNGVMRPGAAIQRVPTFAVVLLKGEVWPGASGFGAVHRSPDPGSEKRAMLRVDMLSQLPLETSSDTPSRVDR